MRKRTDAAVVMLIGLACLCWAGVARSADSESDPNKAEAAAGRAAGDLPRPDGFQRLWSIGTLDPARRKQWPSQKPGQHELASVAVESHFVLFIARGDAANPSNIDCYEVPELTAGKPFTRGLEVGGRERG